MKFASNDLHASRAPWKTVFLHYPMFNVGGHGTAWGHEHYRPLLQLSLDAGPSLTARLTARPDTTNDSHVMFTVQPLNGSVPAELEISLSPESAKYYTMQPLLVKTPAEKQQISWAPLRATGLKKVRADASPYMRMARPI